MRSICWLTLVMMLCAGLTSSAFAAAGTLEEPSVALSESIPQKDRDKILAALRIKDAKFVQGNWLNWFTSLHYAGKTEALNLFLDELSRCEGATFSVKFYRLGPDANWAPEGTDWSVFHDAMSNQFTIRINLESESLKIEDLYIPPVVGKDAESEKTSSE